MFLKKLEVNFLGNSIFSYGTKLKTKILALICSSAELWLYFKTFPELSSIRNGGEILEVQTDKT